MTHTLTLDQAGEIDAAWINGGMPDDGMRLYSLRRSGNRTMTFLGVPGHWPMTTPLYVESNGRFLHMQGTPTLDEWQAERDAQAIADRAELEAVLEAEYRDAADTERDLLAGMHW